jgi:hypothetical protein
VENNIKFSLCASAIRPHLWQGFLDSLKNNTIKYEVILAGSIKPQFDISKYPELTYIYSPTKPSQCYEICFRSAKGELISWGSDDSTYPPHALDDIYNFFKSFNDNKLVVAFRTVENGRDITNVHRLIGNNSQAPRMAPFGVMETKFFRELGGYDRRFVCGQSENDVVMRVYEGGGRLEISSIPVFVNHRDSHNNSETVFRGNYYKIDREVLEGSWLKNGIVQSKRLDAFEPFSNVDILTKTQSYNKGKW